MEGKIDVIGKIIELSAFESDIINSYTPIVNKYKKEYNICNSTDKYYLHIDEHCRYSVGIVIFLDKEALYDKEHMKKFLRAIINESDKNCSFIPRIDIVYGKENLEFLGDTYNITKKENYHLYEIFEQENEHIMDHWN